MKSLKLPQDLVCLIPVIVFLILVFPFLGLAPALDPMINYRHSASFFIGGFPEILAEGSTAHPPLLYILDGISFFIFGKQPLSINLLGLILFIFSSTTFYFSVKKIFGFKVAGTSTILLFLNPLIMVNYFFVTSEVLMLAGMILIFTGLAYQKTIVLSLSLALMCLMKETALSILGGFLLAGIFLIVCKQEKVYQKTENLFMLFKIFLPSVFVIALWYSYTQLIGTTEWHDSPFIETADSSYLVVLKNILTLNFLNKFLQSNLENAFLLNWQWVFTLTNLVLLPFSWKKIRKLFDDSLKYRTFLIFGTISFVYAILTLSFPTWTIPRYSIPILLFSYLLLALQLSFLKKIFFEFLIVLLLIISFFANTTSLDPFSIRIVTRLYYGIDLYDWPFWNGSSDRLMYNIQFLQAVKNQNTIIQKAVSVNADAILTNCDEFKLGEKLFSIYLHNDFYPNLSLQKKIECINIGDEKKIKDFQTKIIYNPLPDFSFSPLGNI